MGKLIIDGNSVFEIDEECANQKKLPEHCDIKRYLKETNKSDKDKKLTYKKENK